MADLIKETSKKEISIFRTSVNSENEVRQLKPLLDVIIGSKNWNFDLEDCDNILRVNYYPIMHNFWLKK